MLVLRSLHRLELPWKMFCEPSSGNLPSIAPSVTKCTPNPLAADQSRIAALPILPLSRRSWHHVAPRRRGCNGASLRMSFITKSSTVATAKLRTRIPDELRSTSRRDTMTRPRAMPYLDLDCSRTLRLNQTLQDVGPRGYPVFQTVLFGECARQANDPD